MNNQDTNFEIISFNCRSIYTKLSELKIFIYQRKPHCVCLAETWLIEDKMPNFINYQAFWSNRINKRGGGIGILIRSDISVLPSQFTKI